MTNLRVLGLVWQGTGIALPTPPGYTPPRVHPCTTVTAVHGPGMQSAGANSAVGLKSVHQLSLCGHFSGFSLMTEVYNLATARNPNDHKSIPGFD